MQEISGFARARARSNELVPSGECLFPLGCVLGSESLNFAVDVSR